MDKILETNEFNTRGFYFAVAVTHFNVTQIEDVKPRRFPTV